MAEAADAVSSNFEPSADILGPASDVPIVERGSGEENSPYDLKHLTFNDDCAPSSSHRIQVICQTYCFSAPFDVQSVQNVMKDALAAFASASGDVVYLADLKESYAADKAELEKSLASSEENLVGRGASYTTA